MLPYKNKGDKIPCDFEANNPGVNRSKVVKKKKKVTRKDNEQHEKAVEQAKNNDGAKVEEEAKDERIKTPSAKSGGQPEQPDEQQVEVDTKPELSEDEKREILALVNKFLD